LGHPGRRIVCFTQGGERYEVDAHGTAGAYRLAHAGRTCSVTHAQRDGARLGATFDGIARRYTVRVDAAHVLLHDGERRSVLDRVEAFAFTRSVHQAGDRVIAP